MCLVERPLIAVSEFHHPTQRDHPASPRVPCRDAFHPHRLGADVRDGVLRERSAAPARPARASVSCRRGLHHRPSATVVRPVRRMHRRPPSHGASVRGCGGARVRRAASPRSCAGASRRARRGASSRAAQLLALPRATGECVVELGGRLPLANVSGVRRGRGGCDSVAAEHGRHPLSSAPQRVRVPLPLRAPE